MLKKTVSIDRALHDSGIWNGGVFFEWAVASMVLDKDVHTVQTNSSSPVVVVCFSAYTHIVIAACCSNASCNSYVVWQPSVFLCTHNSTAEISPFSDAHWIHDGGPMVCSIRRLAPCASGSSSWSSHGRGAWECASHVFRKGTSAGYRHRRT